MTGFRATHRHRESGNYVMLLDREGDRATYRIIEGSVIHLDEAEFSRDFVDLSAFSGYADGLPDPVDAGGFRVWTREEIAAAASPNGGYGKKECAALGVHYPPKRGWQEALLAGFNPNNPPPGIKDAVAASVSGDTELLKKVVIDIIEQGYGHLLHHIPGLLDRFGAQLPDDNQEDSP